MNLKERIDHIVRDYIYRLENNIEIPSWLEKQKRAIYLIAEDQRGGLFLLAEGLLEERDWITNSLTSGG